MSCNYADGLSPYANKGILGTAERFDDEATLAKKCKQLADMIRQSKHTVIHTGAGISTAAGIPDFRGPKGVWTLEKKGEKPNVNVSFNDARPTKTHMALKSLLRSGHIHYIVSQNIDGLHLKSGLTRSEMAELHGNMYIEQCSKCKRQYVRSSPVPTVGQKDLQAVCRGGQGARPCRGGTLKDTILDWEHNLPDDDADMASMHSTIADLNICMGTTLQIVPSGNFPLKHKKFGGQLVICNLQPTKHDKKADLIVSTYVDTVLEIVCKNLGVEIDEYSPQQDPTKQGISEQEWTIQTAWIKEVEKLYAAKLKAYRESTKKRKSGGAVTDKDEGVREGAAAADDDEKEEVVLDDKKDKISRVD